MQRVYVIVPGVEDITPVISMLRAAGAQITTERREFSVEGPLTAKQAAAVWQLSWYLASGTERSRPVVRVEPDGDLRAALDAMCPDGWTKDAFADEDDDWHSNDLWWHEQQRLQTELRRRPAAPAQPPAAAPPPAQVAAEVPPVAEVERRADGTCCGQGGSWAPKEGQPVVIGCMLCQRSGSYWRPAQTVR